MVRQSTARQSGLGTTTDETRRARVPFQPRSDRRALRHRATDPAVNVQPKMTDPRIANKRSYFESNGRITRCVQIA
jgi:hypothetical protein